VYFVLLKLFKVKETDAVLGLRGFIFLHKLCEMAELHQIESLLKHSSQKKQLVGSSVTIHKIHGLV